MIFLEKQPVNIHRGNLTSMSGARVHCKTPCFSLGQRGRTPPDQQDLRRIGNDAVTISSMERAERGTCSRNRESGLAQSLQRRRRNGRKLACEGSALRTRRGKDRRRLQVEPQRRGAVSGCRAIWCSPGNGFFSRLRYQSSVGTVTGVAAGVHKQGAEWHGHERKLHSELFLHLRNCSVLQLGKWKIVWNRNTWSIFHDSTLITLYRKFSSWNKSI